MLSFCIYLLKLYQTRYHSSRAKTHLEPRRPTGQRAAFSYKSQGLITVLIGHPIIKLLMLALARDVKCTRVLPENFHEGFYKRRQYNPFSPVGVAVQYNRH